MNDETTEALRDPQPGDLFHEMFSWWMVVVHREGERVVVGTLSPPGSMPDNLKWREFGALVAYQHAYSYGTIPGSWLRYDRRIDVTGWYEAMCSAKHIDESLKAGEQR